MSGLGIILSSRIRLARNVDGYPFLLKDERAARLLSTVCDKLKKIDRFTFYRISAPLEGVPSVVIEEAAAVAMMERRLISPDLIKNKAFSAVAVSDDERVSIMLGEEDHIREQCIVGGLSLQDAYARLTLIDRALGGEIRFAFDPVYGYLTSCLTNVGTGMRASVMMFLPALSLTGRLTECLAGVRRLNMAVRGVYGEGSEAEGFMYQISNQRSLGITENEIILSVESVALQLKEAELRARELLIKTMPDETRDRIMRSFGILTNCYKLSHLEFVSYMALVKLGAFYGMFNINDDERLEELILEMSPANISIRSQSMAPLERDILRAETVRRELIKNVNIAE